MHLHAYYIMPSVSDTLLNYSIGVSRIPDTDQYQLVFNLSFRHDENASIQLELGQYILCEISIYDNSVEGLSL
jgi:hypothetical protein